MVQISQSYERHLIYHRDTNYRRLKGISSFDARMNYRETSSQQKVKKKIDACAFHALKYLVACLKVLINIINVPIQHVWKLNFQQIHILLHHL